MFLVFLILIAIPFIEIFAFVQVADWIGALNAIGLLLLVSIVGVVIVWRQGTSAWRRIRDELATGKVPGAALVDGALIFAAGVLLMIPGFVTDAIGLALLIPPVRHGVRGVLSRRFKVRVVETAPPQWAPPGDPPVIDV